MVARGAHHHHRCRDVHQGHRRPGKAVLPRCQRVVQEQRRQVLVVHARGQAGLVGIPAHQVEAGIVLAHQVAPRVARPHQVLGGQELEGAAHLLAGQVTTLVHALAQVGQLVLVDEHPQLPGLGKVGLRRQQDDRAQLGHIGRHQGLLLGRAGLLALQAPQGGGRNRQEGTAQAIAHGVDAGRAGARLHRRHGLQHAGAQVVLHLQVAVGGVRVAPRDDEHRMALADQVAHHRVLRRQIQDVVLHDARGHDQHRLGQHLLGLRAVLDQLDQVVAEHHLARCARHILADGEFQRLQLVGRSVGLGLARGLHIFGKQLHALAQALALRGLGLDQHLGVGGRPVGRRQGIHPLPGEELDHMAVVARHAVDLRGLAPPAVGRLEVFLDSPVRPLLPGDVLEAGIAFAAGLQAGLRRLLRQLHRLVGQRHLFAWRRGQVHHPVGGGQAQGHGGQAHGAGAQRGTHLVIQGLRGFGRGRSMGWAGRYVR